MKHDREFWTRHVRAGAQWADAEGVLRRHRLSKGTLGYWASTLERQKAAGDGAGGGRAHRGQAAAAQFAYRVGGAASIPAAAVAGNGPRPLAGGAVGAGAVAHDRAGGQRGAGIRAAGLHRHEEADQRAGA